ncbi:MAG: efflux RND transporter periplasmic adaptor subunit [Oxalobacter sp.]|nr:efflux RND transporter periplasmic adaptor subunit [Oxalobacter sp.]
MLDKLKNLKRPKVWIPIAVVAVLIIILLAYWITQKKSSVNYMTEKARIGSIRHAVEATGEISAVNLVTVGAQVGGQIKKLHVVLGQEVKQGQMIAEIDSTTQENLLRTDKLRLESLKSILTARKTALEVAKRAYERELKLIKTDSTSKDSLDRAKDAYAAAKANVDETTSSIKQMQLTINTDETNLGYTKIRAPLDGTVVSVPVEEGQTVNANQTTPTIIKIANLNDMEIDIQISEGDITKVKQGMPVDYTILSEPNTVFHATLDSLDPGLTTLSDGSYDKSSSGSSSGSSTSAVYYYGKSFVNNPEGKLRIGMMTQCTILVADAQDVLIIPSIAITSSGGKHYVRVLKDKENVEKREIKIGITDGVYTEVVSGLSEGEEVISSEVNEGEKIGKTPRMRGGLRM